MTDTLKVYDAKAGDYAKAFANNAPDKHLARFIAALPTASHVLDLGCGPGTASAQIAAAGHSVDATDGSAEMVAAVTRLHGLPARQMLFDEITGTDIYDGIWANFSLLHAPRAEMPKHLAALARAAKPGALLHIGMKTGTGEGPDALGRFYTYYTEAELTDHLTAAGFIPDYKATGRDKGLAGTTDPWLILQARLAPTGTAD
ncbi:class I SAM-dependent methyltransferase [Alphaproteobacteria bacterium KMM 3653]|uniref:Class I SAM-dependent methyltransferase n=1 Tax=Harenicola maris TaxID=2841044 RepID=A0AAP2CSE8_9RHOB|nr:class I SAM-dependent methyltransferase [Harenicola maris]